jgi:CcmD family protein
MKSNGFLYAAYIVTWAIHFSYILYLTGRARRLREEMRDLDREAGKRGDQRG